MVEQSLYFAIGFLVAGLVAVVAMPAISRRATRLREARMRLRTPAITAAELDAFRARSAVERVQLERRLALVEDASNQLRIAVGRQSVKILALESAAAEHMNVIVDQRMEIAKGESERRDLEIGLRASQIALNDAFAQRDRANVAEARATARQVELEAEASRDRARIAILTARGDNMEGRFEHLSRSARAAAEKAETTRAALTEVLAGQSDEVLRLEGRMRDAILQNERLNERLSRSGVENEESRRRLAELEVRLALSEQARADMLLENSRQLATLADREAALRAAWAGREPSQREREGTGARIAASGHSTASSGDDAALRESIERLGREVSRLFADWKSMVRREDLQPAARSSRDPYDGGTHIGPLNDEPRSFIDASRRRAARSRTPDR